MKNRREKAPIDEETIRKFENDHVLHPWRSQKDYSPPVVERAKGNYFYDTKGRQYLDFSSQYVVTSLGHADERVVKAISEQAGRLPYVSHQFFTEPKARLARTLSEITPGDITKTFFSNGGAEAVEASLKVARLVTGRNKVIARYRAYHGSLYGALSLGMEFRTWPFEPAVPGVVHCLEPYCYRCPFGATYPECDLKCARHVEDIIIREGGAKRVGAFIGEPIFGPGGIIVPPDGYWQCVREICDKYDMLMICDEVMAGIGRTGKWFAIDHWDVVPDIMTMAKGITSGIIPLGATSMRKSVADAFEEQPFTGGHTYSGHTLAMAASSATLEAYIEDGLVERSAEMGKYLMGKLEGIRDHHPCIGDIRGKGLFCGVELVKNRKTREPVHEALMEPPRPVTAKMKIISKAMEEGLYIMAGAASVLMLTPPFTVTKDEIDFAVDVLDRALIIADKENTE